MNPNQLQHIENNNKNVLMVVLNKQKTNILNTTNTEAMQNKSHMKFIVVSPSWDNKCPLWEDKIFITPQKKRVTKLISSWRLNLEEEWQNSLSQLHTYNDKP